MATAGSIVVSLLAKTGSFETDMDRAARRLKGVAKEAETTGKEIDLVARRLNSLVTAAGATVVAFAGTSAAMAMQVAKSMDATAKMAEQIGTTTEALTGLRFAAQQFANVSDQTFDMAMRRMTRRIEEAAQGSGGAKNALDALGLSAQQLSRLSPDKQFLALADAMKNTESQAARLRYTMAIFDTEGMPLVAALQRGSEEMERGIEVARRYGLVLSTDGAQAAQRFVENMDAMRFAAQGFKQELAEAVLPMLVSVTDMMREFGESAGPMGDKVEKVLTLVGAVASATAVIFASRLVSAIWKSTAAWGAATAAAAAHQMTMTRLAGAISGASTVMASASAAAAGGMAVMSRAGSLVLGVLGGPAGLVTAVGLTAAAFLTVGRDAGTASVNIDELAQSFTTLNQRQLELRRFDLEDEVKKLEDQARESGQILQTMEADVAAVFEDAAKGVNITAQELENARRALLEQQEAHANNSAELDRARTLLDQVVTRLRDMDAAARGAAGGVRDLNEAMTNDAGAKYLERLASQAITAGLKTQREQLEALVKAGELRYSPEELEKARKLADHIDRMNAAYKGASSAAKEFESSVKSLIAAHLPEVKATEDLHKNLATLQAAQRAGIVVGQNYTKALESINLAYAKQVNDLLPESIKKAQDQVKAAREQQKQLQQQLRTFGMAESAVLALAAADTDSAIAKLEAAKANEIANGATTERIKHIEAEIQVLRELRDLQLGSAGLQGQLEWREQQRQQWEDWAQDVKTIFDQVGQSLTDAIFEGGKSARDLIKDLFKSLVLRVLIQPVMGGLQGLFMGAGPAGIANAGSAAGGLMGSPTSLFSMFGGNSMGMGISNALTSLSTSSMFAGTGVGNWMMGTAGNVAGMSNLALGGAGFLGGIGAGLLFGNKGYSSAGGGVGGTIGMALGGPVGAIAGSLLGGALGSLFGGREPTTRRMQRVTSEYSDGEYQITSRDSRQAAGTEDIVRQLAESAVQSTNELFERVGVAASVNSLFAITESSYKGDRQGVASGGTLQIGDAIVNFGLQDLYDRTDMTKSGFGGWSEAEMLPRLEMDLQLSVLSAFQAVGDALPRVLSGMLEGIDIRSLGAEQAQELAQRFQLVVDQVSILQGALERLPFEQLRDLSFDAAAGLIEFAGGLEALDAGMTSYFQNFYSEEEKLEWATKQIGDAFGELGMTMPDVTQGAELAKAAYRDLVESLDVTTEEGQRAYATLMTLSGGFHELATGMDQLADATQRALQEFVSSLMGDVNAALSAVQQRGQERIAKLSESFARTDSVFDAYRSQVQALESQWGSLISTMDRSMRDLRGRVDASARLQYDQARAVISTALLTGQLPQTADLGEAIRVAQQGVTGGRYASAFDQREAYLKLANELEALQGIAKPELDAAQASLEQLEKQYNRLRGIEDLSGLSLKQLEKQFAVALSAEEAARTQIAQIERQIAMAQAQYHELVGINDELSTLPGALQALAKAINAAAAAQQAQQQSGAQRSRELQYLADNPDVMAQYGQHGRGMSLEEYARLHYDLHGRKEGRSFDVGTPYVPYDMMANIHRGEIIIDPRSSDILRRYGIGVQGGGSRETEQLLREQLAEVRQQNRYLYEIVKSGKRTERNTGDLSMAVAHNPSDDVVVVF